MDSERYRQVTQIAASSHGVFTRDQAERIGVGDRTLHRWCGLGIVERHTSTAFTIAGTPATWRRTLVLMTSAHPHGLVCHRASVSLWGLVDRRHRAEVLVTHHATRVAGPWSVRETRQLTGTDVAEVDGIAVTSIERTLLDVGRYWPAHRIGQLLDDSVMRELTTYDRFAARLDELAKRGRPGVRPARLALIDRGIDEGTPFEQLMAQLLRRSGLPTPVRELHVRVGDRDYFIDFAYPNASLGVECDSMLHHTKPCQFEADLRRQNDIVGTGMLLLRYTNARLRHDPEAVAAEIRHHLRTRTP